MILQPKPLIRTAELSSIRTAISRPYHPPYSGYYPAQPGEENTCDPILNSGDWRLASYGAMHRSSMDRNYEADKDRFENTYTFNIPRQPLPGERFSDPMTHALCPKSVGAFSSWGEPWGRKGRKFF